MTAKLAQHYTGFAVGQRQLPLYDRGGRDCSCAVPYLRSERKAKAKLRHNGGHASEIMGNCIDSHLRKVTDVIHAALEFATEAVNGKDIRLSGGVAAIRQYLQAGLIDL